MAFPEAATMPMTAAIRDDTTRNLCAAAHLSPDYADGAIREFLTESTRAIPPSPGIDAPTVLREAVAARTRRLARDWVLLALLVLVTLASPALALGWALVGIVLCLVRAGRRHDSLIEIVVSLVGPVAGLAGAALLVWLWELMFAGSGSVTAPSAGIAVLAVLAILAAIVAFAVLLLDRLVVALLVNRSFQRERFVADPVADSWPGERLARTAGRERYAAELQRVARADSESNLVAYRGYEPFVGAGSRLRPISLVIGLEPAAEGSAAGRSGQANGAGTARPFARPFALRELYDHVGARLLAMRHSLSLSPSGRLAWLAERDQVVVPVEDLLVNYDDRTTRMALPNLSGPPSRTLTPEQLAEVIERPREWMRYYRCFRVESWNRELAVTGYLHFGASDRQLYLEWVPCVLYPIAEHLRLRDSTPGVRSLRLTLAALADWVRLPGELLFRMGSLVRRIRPLPVEQGLTQPARYGTALSLRELAAGSRMRNYFQERDARRYVDLLGRRMLTSVGEFLDDKGISVVEFMRQAASIINNHYGDNYGVNNFGSMSGDNSFGDPAERGPARGGGSPNPGAQPEGAPSGGTR